MTQRPLSTDRPSRRRVLGLFGLAPLAAGATLAYPGTAVAHPTKRVPRDLRPGGAYDDLVARLAAEDKFSGTVLLAHRGRPVLVRSYGMANKETSIPNCRDTVYNLASITKTFTAVAIAQLVRNGLLAFTDTIGAHLDGFPPAIADTVTVHQLLTHTSGVGRPALGSGEPPHWASFEEAMAGTLDVIRDTPLRFPPGTAYGYSNDGYFVLGAIVAAVSGRSYFDYIRSCVFEPAGMTSSDFHSGPTVLTDDRIARPHWTQRSGTRVDFATNEHFPFTNGPAGGAYSTVDDLLAFAQALSGDTLLSPPFVDLVTGGKVAIRPSEAPPGPLGQGLFYGYGFLNAFDNDHRVYGHPGNGPGVATRFDVYPDLGWVSVILGNYDTSIAPLVDLGRELITA